MVENALACIFKLADNPIILVESIIKKLLYLMNETSGSYSQAIDCFF
jgi:hypothetical protein